MFEGILPPYFLELARLTTFYHYLLILFCQAVSRGETRSHNTTSRWTSWVRGRPMLRPHRVRFLWRGLRIQPCLTAGASRSFSARIKAERGGVERELGKPCCARAGLGRLGSVGPWAAAFVERQLADGCGVLRACARGATRTLRSSARRSCWTTIRSSCCLRHADWPNGRVSERLVRCRLTPRGRLVRRARVITAPLAACRTMQAAHMVAAIAVSSGVSVGWECQARTKKGRRVRCLLAWWRPSRALCAPPMV